MELTIDRVVAGGVSIPDRGETSASRAFVYGRAFFPEQPLIFHNDRDRQESITANNQGQWSYEVELSENQSYIFYVTTRDGENSSKRWQINKI